MQDLNSHVFVDHSNPSVQHRHLHSCTTDVVKQVDANTRTRTPLRRTQANRYLDEPTVPLLSVEVLREATAQRPTTVKKERTSVAGPDGGDSGSSSDESQGGSARGAPSGNNNPNPGGPPPQPPPPQQPHSSGASVQLDISALKQLLVPTQPRQVNLQQLMKVNPPRFTGSAREDVSEWLDKLESWLELAQLSDVHKIYLLCTSGVLMSGLPQLWMKQQPALAAETQWDKFTKAIEERWAMHAKEKKYHRELQQMKMIGSYDNYCIKFQALTMKIKTMAMVDVLDAFLQGLPEDYRWDIVKKNPSRLTQAMDWGKEFEQALVDLRAVSGGGGRFSHSRTGSSAVSRGARIPSRRVDRSDKMVKLERFWKGRTQPPNNKGTMCYNCHKMGHMASECRSRAVGDRRSTTPLRRPAHPPTSFGRNNYTRSPAARSSRSNTPQRDGGARRVQFYASRPANDEEHNYRVNNAPREAWAQMANSAPRHLHKVSTPIRMDSKGGNRRPQ